MGQCVLCVQGYNMRIHHAFLLILLVCQFGLGFTGKAKKDEDAKEPEEAAADAEGSELQMHPEMALRMHRGKLLKKHPVLLRKHQQKRLQILLAITALKHSKL